MKAALILLACALGPLALPQPAAARDLNRVLEGFLSDDHGRGRYSEERRRQETIRDTREKQRLDRRFGNVPSDQLPNQVHRGRVNPDFQEYLNSRP